MLTIPSTVQALFQTDGVYKNFRVHFPNGEFTDITNDNIVQESVKFTESLCSQSTFKFGLAEASVLEFETVGIGNMYGMTIEASIEIDCSSLSAADKTTIANGTWDGTWDSVNELFSIPYGTFRVESCPRDHQSMAHRQVTAYSKDLLSGLSFPTKSNAKDFQISLNGLIASKTGTGLTEETSATISALGINAIDGAFFAYIPSGCIDGGFYSGSGSVSHAPAKYVWLCTGTTDSPINAINDAVITEDVILPTGTVDSTQVSQLISVIAEQLTNAGVDLTLNNTFTQVYSDNLESLQEECVAFYPTINDTYGSSVSPVPRTTWGFYPGDDGVVIGSGGSIFYFSHSYPAVLNEYNPVIGGKDTTSAFYGEDYIKSSTRRLDLFFIKILTSDNVFLRVYDTTGNTETFIKLRYADDNIDLLPFLTKDMNITSVRQFSVDTPSPYFVMNNTGKYSKYFYAYLGGEKNLASDFKGALELNAMFCKANRFGSGEAVFLDDSSPIAISPGDYAECWWDEYDIDSIGTVTISYQDDDGNGNTEETDTEISIGTGASRYDMTDNEALKNLSSTDLTAVTKLIKSHFAPNVGTVAFTPTELTMQGWPWIEAGDALQITAEDGTIVDTYALRVELDGIQHLQAVITAEGGEIIEEVS